MSNTSASDNPVTQDHVRDLYSGPPSLSYWLPWVDYADGVFTLEDYQSVGVIFEVKPIAVEARGEEFLDKVDRDIQNVLCNAVPQENPPYILSIYTADESSLREAKQSHREFVRQHATDPRYQQFTDAYLKVVEEHYDNVTDPDGYFFDDIVTKSKWSGVTRKVRCCLYRRINSLADIEQDQTPTSAIKNVFFSVKNALEDAGFQVDELGMKDLYEWLFPWFNREHYVANGDTEALLEAAPYPGDDNIPYGTDLSSLLFLEQPESNAEKGTWCFTNSYHRAVTINNLRRVPVPGQVSAEIKRGDKFFALIDSLPNDSIYHTTIVFQPKDLVESQIALVKDNSRGDHPDAKNSYRQAERALEAISDGDLLFPTVSSILVKAPSEDELRRKVMKAESLLLSGGFTVIREKDELLPLNQYIRSLPFNYDFSADKRTPQSRLHFASHLSKILCLYGRSRGTKTPGLPFFNRGAEPLTLDFLVDRITNAFGVLLGPPGTGKSALLQFLLWYFVGVHNARVFILEKGGSFRLFGEFAKRYGLTVNQVTMSPSSDYAFSPFADAVTMARQDRREAARFETEQELEVKDREERAHLFEFDDEADEAVAKRDYLGEMELSARVMITGGEKKEEDNLMRADRVLIRNAIKRAAIQKLEQIERDPELPEEHHTVLPEDVASELDIISKDEQLIPESRKAASRMAMSMRLFCDGIAGRFFNRPGANWDEADVTILEFGILAQEGYGDQLALAFMSLMNRICYVVERDEYQDKPTIILGDEAHLFLPNPLLAVYLVKIIKMFRKLGTWPWLATQNLDDFSGDSNKMLSMFEWVIAMSCPKEEIENISKFRDLTPEEKGLLRAARKCPGKYTEGVILSDQVKSLFRNVSPGLFLASAMTEKDEKVERKKLMDQHGISELEAVRMVADRIARKRT